jgi:hypothetical protein
MRNIMICACLSMLVFACSKEDKSNNTEPNKVKNYFDNKDFFTDGLIAYYPFNSDVNDYSGNNLNGLGNNVVFSEDRFGNSGGACYFNGKNSYIEIKNSDALNDNEYTICFWYRTDIEEDTMSHIFISKADSAEHGYFVDVYNSGHMSSFGFGSHTQENISSDWFSFGPGVKVWKPGVNNYEFLAISFNKTDFIDFMGGKKWTRTPGYTFNDNKFNLYIGRSDIKKCLNFCGEIDDLLIYNRILSDDEILKLSNWGKSE